MSNPIVKVVRHGTVDLLFTDNDGCEYDIDEDFTEGDIVLLSDPDEDAMAYRVDRTILANASPVFRDMFSGPFDGSYIHLNTGSDTLEPFFTFLTKPRNYKRNWETTLRVIAFAQQYQCETLARDLLYTASAKDPGKLRFKAFVLACQYEHLTAACRILRWGASGEKAGKEGISLRPNTAGWTPQLAARLSIPWLWALSGAVQSADDVHCGYGTSKNREKEEYWRSVIGDFMIRVTM